MANPEAAAKVAEIGGSALAVTCGACRWIADNHDFLSGVGVGIGTFVAVAGLVVSTYYRHKEERRRQEAHNHQFFKNRSSNS
jgi:uncharacterized membrane protein